MKFTIRRSVIIAVAILLLCAVIYMTCTSMVPTGYTGILTTFGRVEDYTLDAGLHMKNPFQAVVLMDNREQKTAFNTEAFSSDIQQVEVVGSVNFAYFSSLLTRTRVAAGSTFWSCRWKAASRMSFA